MSGRALFADQAASLLGPEKEVLLMLGAGFANLCAGCVRTLYRFKELSTQAASRWKLSAYCLGF